MGKQLTQNRILSIFFWFKVLIAVLIAAGGMAFLSQKVYFMHRSALVLKGQRAAPIEIDGTKDACNSQRTGLARLEPPNGKMITGFHLNWNIETPADIKRITGNNPGIV